MINNVMIYNTLHSVDKCFPKDNVFKIIKLHYNDLYRNNDPDFYNLTSRNFYNLLII
jgi:hypothetical protein